MKTDVYQKVTDKIIADLEKGELSWLKPWNAGNLEGKITKPLRHNGMPYNGINVLMLWGASVEAGYIGGVKMSFGVYAGASIFWRAFPAIFFGEVR